MIARIVVDHRFKETDRVFDYLVPEELEGQVVTGSRVIVPFSKNDTEIEGFCVGFSKKSDVKKLKSVIRLASDMRAFDDEMLEVIEWMHVKYLVSYQDIIRAIIPSGSNLKSEEIIYLDSERAYEMSAGDDYWSKRYEEIVTLLEENGNKLPLKDIEKAIGAKGRATVNEMLKDGVLLKTFKQRAAVSDKTAKHVRLAIDKSEAPEAIEKLSRRAPVQAEILSLVYGEESVPLSEVSGFSGGAKGAVNALVKKGLIEIYNKVLERDPLKNREFVPTKSLDATYEQRRAIEAITHGISEGENRTFLLHGVTGSGKTEVFMQAIDFCVKGGKTALVLVPEISLTSQMVSRFVSRFGERVAVLHSALSLGERHDQWRRVNGGGADIVIGARSAVFAPLKNIGIIIIDEEHSSTYKSEMTPRYQAREVAAKRAELCGAALVLASATPSTESMYRARNGEYELLTMRERYNKNQMPDIIISDMREELRNGNKSMLSERLKSEINVNLRNGEQTILFLNRRGYSTFVSCRNCGFTAKCPNCSISLTYHRAGNILKCHYCGYEHKNYTVCPSCSSKYIRYFGGGTQKVEDEIKRLFPSASTIRMDMDTTGKKQSHEKILERFENEKIDILIGTQMVAKGLDFENVTLVGVVSADTMLNMQDYRSAERTFSMLEQVSGRAGRGSKKGRAVIQTYTPENEAISLVKEHNYNKFYEGEILQRKLLWYPPYSQMVCVMFSSHSHNLTAQAARFFRKELGDIREIVGKSAVLGPVPAAVSKINNKYRYQLVIKCADYDKLNGALEKARAACKSHKNYGSVAIVIDKDPNMI